MKGWMVRLVAMQIDILSSVVIAHVKYAMEGRESYTGCIVSQNSC